MVKDLSVPFYRMKSNEKPDFPKFPDKPEDQIAGLKQALRNTKKSIAEGKYSKEELETHAKYLKRQLLTPKERDRGLVMDQIEEARKMIETCRKNNEVYEVEKWEKYLQELEQELSGLN